MVPVQSVAQPRPIALARDNPDQWKRFLALTVGSVGVVYGDIGTSPIYAFRAALAATAGPSGTLSSAEILGLLSLILWALTLLVTVKYLLILTRADNNGEGGTLALMALAQRALGKPRYVIVLLGMAAAALFYGDALITPALSVLSAVEGLSVATPAFSSAVLPLTVAILVGLFLAQSRGTARVAAFFGPITILWMVVLAVSGAYHVVARPEVLQAINPAFAVAFLAQHGTVSFLALGAVFLAVTGAEALYADLGHFGRRPIQTAWLCLVLPSLALNYLGQGALVLADPAASDNPFFKMVPGWALLPTVFIATAATIIASQAVITGAFSLTRQAIQLGLLPRLEIRHTSETAFGQIYMPRVNLALFVGVMLLVGLFRSSDALASAYGIAVSGTMVVTAIMAFVVIWRCWQWRWYAAAALIAPFFAIEAVFVASNLLKFVEGGWVPLLLAAALMLLMITWRRGSRILLEKTRRSEVPLRQVVEKLEARPPLRVPGTAMFLTGDPEFAPTALLHSLKHYKVLHEQNVILSVRTADRPRVDPDERVIFESLSPTFARILVTYGFLETPNLPGALAAARRLGWSFDIMSTSFFLSRRAVRPGRDSEMPPWQDKLFISLSRGASDATGYFRIPTERVVEIGMQVTV
ncbi:MAG: potassium transporter Kup [Bauldia sp.]